MSHVHCYNKGCGQKYDPENNTDDSCTYHPGVPVFHDALKGWSCCDKRSTDFTQFLNYPGCTQGRHSNEKPVEPEKPKQEDPSVTVVEAPKQRAPIKKRNNADRPSIDEPRIKLKMTVGASLKSALEKLTLESPDEKKGDGDATDGIIQVGTSCKNNACKACYQSESSDSEDCMHHPGVPIFHEGMKYWSCCQRKTSDFDNFLAQEGCEKGRHKWTKPQALENCFLSRAYAGCSVKIAWKQVRHGPTSNAIFALLVSMSADGEQKSCRFDWHQTGPLVCLSIFSKTAMPEVSVIEANKVFLRVHIVFDGGKSIFEKEFILRDLIDPEQSQVKMLGTKVEINLRKAEAFSWPTLELPTTQ